MTEEKKEEKVRGRRTFLATAAGTIVGAIVTGVGVWALTPKVEVPKEVIKEVTKTVTAPGATVTAPAVTTTVTAPAVAEGVPVSAVFEPGHPLYPGSSDEIALYNAKILAKKAPPGAKISVLVCEGTTAQIDWLIPIWKEQTGIDVEYLTVPLYDLPVKMMEEAVAKSGVYDALIHICEYIPDAVEAGLAKDIDPWVEKYQCELWNWPAPYSGGHYQKTVQYMGKNYQVIWDGCLWNAFYRSDYLDDPDEQRAFESEHGYPLPIWGADTWSQLYDMMKFFHRPEEVQKLTGLKGITGGWWFRTKEESSDVLLIKLVSKGGVYFDDDMNAMVDSPEGIAALEDMKKETEFLPEIAIAGTWTDMYADFPAGKNFSAFSWTSLGKWSTMGAIKGRYKIGKVPGTIVNGDNIRVTIRRGTLSWFISNYSDIPELAYLFMQYMTSPRVSSICISKTGYWDPARENHFSYPPILEIYGVGAGVPVEQVQQSLYNNRFNQTVCMPNVLLIRYGEYQESLTSAVHGYITGTIPTAKDALTKVRDKWNEITEDVGRDAQLERWNHLKKAFPPLVRKLHGW